MQILFLVFMFVLGAIFGSFFCCQVRRMEVRCSTRGTTERGSASISAGRPWQTAPWDADDPKGRRAGRTRPEREHELPIRSACLHCKKRLKWYDNIPIISWLILRGRCRNCHKKIGSAEIISELASALALFLIGTTINVETASIASWLEFVFITIFTLLLLFLAIYDGITGELPVIGLTFSIICAIIIIILPVGNSFLVVGFFDWPTFLNQLSQPLLSALLFGGIYLILYLVSKGKWVGDGDWLLCLAIGLALGSPWLSLVALFVANFSACLIMYPLVKKKKNHQIYFGPFLVLAFVITYTFRDIILLCIS